MTCRTVALTSQPGVLACGVERIRAPNFGIGVYAAGLPLGRSAGRPPADAPREGAR